MRPESEIEALRTQLQEAESRLAAAIELLETGREIVDALCRWIPKDLNDKTGSLAELLNHAESFSDEVLKATTPAVIAKSGGNNEAD